MQCWASQSASLRNFCARFLLNLGRTIFIVDIYTPPFRSCYPVNVNRYKVFGFSFHIGTEGGHWTADPHTAIKELLASAAWAGAADCDHGCLYLDILCQLCLASHLFNLWNNEVLWPPTSAMKDRGRKIFLSDLSWFSWRSFGCNSLYYSME